VRRQYGALEEVLESLNHISKDRPLFAKDIAPRIGVENRLPEFIDEALRLDEIPKELVGVFKRTSEASVEPSRGPLLQVPDAAECDRVVDLVNVWDLRRWNRCADAALGQPSKAASVVGLLSRLDVPTLLELLPARMPEMNRFFQDMIVRQIAYVRRWIATHAAGALELLDPAVLPMAVDEIGMSGDRTTAGACMAMAQAGDATGRSPFLQLKALETLGRLREVDSTGILRGLLDAKKMFKWTYHREIRIAAAQALAKIDPRYNSQIISEPAWNPANWLWHRWNRLRLALGCGNAAMSGWCWRRRSRAY